MVKTAQRKSLVSSALLAATILAQLSRRVMVLALGFHTMTGDIKIDLLIPASTLLSSLIIYIASHPLSFFSLNIRISIS